MKKLLSILLALTLVLALGVTAFAQDVETTQGGNGTITVNYASKGTTYTLYKIFEATTDGDEAIAYQLLKVGGEAKELTDAMEAAGFTADTAGNITAGPTWGTDGKLESTTIEAMKAYGTAVTKADGTSAIESDGTTLTFKNLTNGYYLLVSDAGNAVGVKVLAGTSTTIDEKNRKDPTPTDDDLKYFVDDAGVKINTQSASIGKTVKYQLSLTTTNYDANGNQIYQYTLKDTATNVKVNMNNVIVKVGTTTTLTKDTDYTITANGNGFTIVVPWVSGDTDGDGEKDDGETWTSLYDNGAELTVTYEAEVLSIDSNGKAKNSATWSYNGNNDSTPDTPEVDTYELIINKTDSDGNSLDGAEFKLYDKDGNEIALVPVTKTVTETDAKTGKEVTTEVVDYYRPATTEEQRETGFTSATIVAGSATVKGLGNGTYSLEETKAPAGYNKLTSREEVTINGATATKAVVNESGAELPSTGGIGTTIFTVVGIILMAGAAILLITKKRMEGKETD